MSNTQIYTGAAAMVLGALAMWLMLPRGRRPGRLLGCVLGSASLVLFGSLGAGMGTLGSDVAFASLGGVTVISAAATVTFRSPVYCALWFALSLLGTAGLFLMQGAQFLGVATVVVYAGAILVTFLFVLMLAQPGGDAYYGRVSWEGILAAATGAVIVFFLTVLVGGVLNPYPDSELVAALTSFRPEESGGLSARHIQSARLEPDEDGTWRVQVGLNAAAPVLSPKDIDRLRTHLIAEVPRLTREGVGADDLELNIAATNDPLLEREASDRTKAGGVLNEEHVASLGAQLFSRHLIALEVAGTLLLVALVGAIAIVQHGGFRQTTVNQAAAGSYGRG